MFRADVERCLSVNGRAVRRGRIVTLYKIGSMAATRENVPCGLDVRAAILLENPPRCRAAWW